MRFEKSANEANFKLCGLYRPSPSRYSGNRANEANWDETQYAERSEESPNQANFALYRLYQPSPCWENRANEAKFRKAEG
jgi:hypothetical protein